MAKINSLTLQALYAEYKPSLLLPDRERAPNDQRSIGISISKGAVWLSSEGTVITGSISTEPAEKAKSRAKSVR